MAHFQRHFTVQEAEALLPRVDSLMMEVQMLKRKIDRKVAAWRRKSDGGAANLALVQGQVDFLVTQVNSRLERLSRMGCQPKDLDQGLVDFPSQMNGREVSLCWKRGEKRIGYWHGLGEGFPGRKPLQTAASPRSAGE